MALAHPDVHRLTSAEYDRMVASGALESVRVELVDGLLVDVTPPGPEHSAAIQALTRLFAGRADLLRVQLPLACAEGWRPEPDVALAEPSGPTRHPPTAHLVVEVVVTARAEAERKLPGYALAAVPAVWLVDVPTRTAEVLTTPRSNGYADRASIRGEDPLDPAVSGIAPFSVRDLFAAAGMRD